MRMRRCLALTVGTRRSDLHYDTSAALQIQNPGAMNSNPRGFNINPLGFGSTLIVPLTVLGKQ